MTRKSRTIAPVDTPPAVWWFIAGLFAIGVLAYCNSFHAPLVFDDLLSIQKNTGVRFGEFGRDPFAGRWLLFVTFTLNYLWTGQEVWSYHLVNLVLHLINGVLIFFIALRIFERTEIQAQHQRFWAFLAAAFFLVQPVQTESVTYISQRAEVLSTLFYAVAFLLFVRWPEAKIGVLASVVIAVPYLLAVNSKESAISLPAVLFLYDFIFISECSFRRLLSRWTFYATYLIGGVVVGYYLVTVVLRQSVGVGLAGHLSRSAYFLTELRVITRYIFLVFFPVGLNLDYQYRASSQFLEPAVVLSFLFLSSIIVLAWSIRRKHKVFAFSIFWFFLALAPTSSVIPILDVIFEHRLYLPLVGVCLSFPCFIDLLLEKVRSQYKTGLSIKTVSLFILTLLVIGTLQRNYVWGDEVRLFEDGVLKSPKNARAYDGLMWSYYKRGEYQKAAEAMRMGMDHVPESASDFSETLALMYLRSGRYDDAIPIYKASAERPGAAPDRAAMSWNNLGLIALSKWNQLKLRRNTMSPEQFKEERDRILKPGAEAFLKATELDTGVLSYLDSYLNVLFDMGAEGPFVTQAISRITPQNGAFHDLYVVGKFAMLKGLQEVDEGRNGSDYLQQAVKFFERAEASNKSEKLLFFNHALILNYLGDQDGAIVLYLQAIRLDTLFNEAHFNLGMIYVNRKETAKAMDHLTEVLRYDPNNRTANLNLGKLYCSQGDRESARKYLQTVLGLNPNDGEATTAWHQCGL